MTNADELLAAARKIDHLAVVIEAHARRCKDGNYTKILAALKAIEAAVDKATDPFDTARLAG